MQIDRRGISSAIHRGRAGDLPRIAFFLPVLLALLLPAFVSARAAYDAGFLQVELSPGTSIDAVNALYGTTTADSLPPLYLLNAPAGVDEAELIANMTSDPGSFICVEHAFRDETPEGVRQMIVAAVGGTIDDYLDQSYVERIHLPAIHEYARGAGIKVAVLDTGVLPTHEVLEGVIVAGGYDFVDNDADPLDEAQGFDEDGDGEIDEAAGHGTLVAGIIHLVAPEAEILPIRVLDDEGNGTTFALAKGIRYAVEQGADVINMSLGLPERSGVIAHELARAGLASVMMVSAAGNLGIDEVYYPASDARVLMVTALDSLDVKADFSNYHARVALSAPGVGIFGPYADGAYAIGAGTSFATAFVSGQCALIRDLAPTAEFETLYGLAVSGTTNVYDISANQDYLHKLGSGRVDGLRTLLVANSSADVDLPAPRPTLGVTPNPFFAGGILRLSLPAQADGAALRVTLHDLGGRTLRSYALSPGETGLSWDGRDGQGRSVPAGIYWVRVEAASRMPVVTGRVLLVR